MKLIEQECRQETKNKAFEPFIDREYSNNKIRVEDKKTMDYDNV